VGAVCGGAGPRRGVGGGDVGAWVWRVGVGGAVAWGYCVAADRSNLLTTRRVAPARRRAGAQARARITRRSSRAMRDGPAVALEWRKRQRRTRDPLRLHPVPHSRCVAGRRRALVLARRRANAARRLAPAFVSPQASPNGSLGGLLDAAASGSRRESAAWATKWSPARGCARFEITRWRFGPPRPRLSGE
jgi:hypothetical protein